MKFFTKCFTSLAVIFLSMLILEGCAVSPRLSSWDAPARLTYKQVFDAAIRSGGETGMQLGVNDRETGSISFTQNVGDMVVGLSVSIKKMPDKRIQVQTTATTSKVGVMGIAEEFINKFHAALFRNLRITSASESNVSIKEM
jgi:hypothetical protein